MIPDLDPVFLAAHKELKPRTPAPEISAEFFPFAGLNHTARYRQNRLLVRVSDLLQDAPPQILHSLALILLARVYRKRVDPSHHDRYRLFTLSAEIQERARAARCERGRIPRPAEPQGKHYDLEFCFDRLNREYFGGSLERPRLSWSVRRSRYTLGRYDATHHAICISRIFDSSAVPEYVLEYVMYHEMLHIKHRSRLEKSRMIAHTGEFRREERGFRFFGQAKDWLKARV